MIKRLRRKFVLVALASVAAVLAIILAGINIANYRSMCDQLDERVDMIVDAGGTLDDFGFDGHMGPGGPADGGGHGLMDGDGEFAGDGGWDIMPLMGFGRASSRRLAEAPFDTRYFTALLDDASEVGSCDVTHIAAVDEATAAEMAIALSGSRDDARGFTGSYRYRVGASEADGSRLVVFVDAMRELEGFRSFLLASIAAAVLGLLGVLALLVPLSSRVVQPFVESHERQRRFVTDASHELKTPLAIILSSVDVVDIEQGGASEWTDSIRAQVARLSDLTQKLVSLAKADEGPQALNVGDFDLSASAERVWQGFVPVAKTSGRSLTRDIDEALTCHGDQVLIEQAMSLLLDNALKYSDEGGTVSLEVSQRRGVTQISVTNTLDEGVVEPGSHAEFFDRFYRADESRSQSGGHGIGLAVVRAVAEAHGGVAEAHSEDGRAITFSLRF